MAAEDRRVAQESAFRPAFSLTHDDVYTTSVHPRFFFDNSPEPPPLAPHATTPSTTQPAHPFLPSQILEASRQASLSSGFPPSSSPPMPNLSLAPVQSSVAPSQTSELNSELRSFRVNTNFTAASEAGVGGIRRITSPIDFFEPRHTTSLLALYEDDAVNSPMVQGIPTGLFAETIDKPVFRQGNIPGAEGIWAIVKWLFAVFQISFCQRILNSRLNISPRSLASEVFETIRVNPAFKNLYQQHCGSLMAINLAGGVDKNVTWDFSRNTAENNALTVVFIRWLIMFGHEHITRFMTGVRCDTAWAVTQLDTMGIRLLPNELIGRSKFLYNASRRSSVAQLVYDKIHPGHQLSDDHPDKPKDRALDNAFMSYFSSPTLYHVCNSIVGHLNPLNVALSVKLNLQPNTVVTMPKQIMPLAALFVETEILTVCKSRSFINGERVSLPQSYFAISSAERSNYRVFFNRWNQFIADDSSEDSLSESKPKRRYFSAATTEDSESKPKHRHFNAATKLISTLDTEHGLNTLISDYTARRERQGKIQRASHGAFEGIDQMF